MTDEQERDQRFSYWWELDGHRKAAQFAALFSSGYPEESEVKEKAKPFWDAAWESCMELMVNR